MGEEERVFRFTLGHGIAMVLVISGLTYLQAYALKWMLPKHCGASRKRIRSAMFS